MSDETERLKRDLRSEQERRQALESELNELRKKLSDCLQKSEHIGRLDEEKKLMEKKYKNEINQLSQQVKYLNNEVEKANNGRVEALKQVEDCENKFKDEISRLKQVIEYYKNIRS